MGFQNVKKNKNDCIQLMEDIHQVLYGIINLHIHSDMPGSLPPPMFDHIGKFIEHVPSAMVLETLTLIEQNYA
jgi:hypothetical protein